MCQGANFWGEVKRLLGEGADLKGAGLSWGRVRGGGVWVHCVGWGQI